MRNHPPFRKDPTDEVEGNRTRSRARRCRGHHRRPWGLLRHYWVIIKLLITLLSTIILIIHMRLITHMAEVAAETMLASADMRRLGVQLVVDAAAAVVALLVATTLSIYKPRGVTEYGAKKA